MSNTSLAHAKKPLGEVALLRRGITYSADMLVESDAGIPYVNMKSFKKGGGFNKQGLKFYSGPYLIDDLVQKGDLLIANTDVTLDGDIVGIPAYLPEHIRTNPVLFSHHVTRIRLNSEIDSHYLYYLLNSEEYRRWMHKYARGTTVLMLDMTAIKRIPMHYPATKRIQCEIVKRIDIFDQTIEKTEALIEKYQHIKAGLMHDLFTRGITADGKLRPPPREQAPELYQETPIGWIPKDWDYELLDKLTNRSSGHTPNRNHPEYWNGGVKWISLSDSRRLDSLYITDTDYEISKLGIQNSSAVMLPTGVVVMSRDAGVGKSAITTQKMAVSQHFMAWQCGNNMDNYFLYYWLQFKKRMFQNIAMGSTIVTIGLPYFKRLKISSPKELTEQIHIGQRLKNMDLYIFSLNAELEKLKKQKSGLMHDLLTGKVSVKVDESEAPHV